MPPKRTTEDFIAQSQLRHGDKYDYTKTTYIGNHKVLTIMCPTHGNFLQTPKSHLQGHGCPTCGGSEKDTTETFIQKATVVHKGVYDYKKVSYTNSKTKITITCLVHGDFAQIPSTHLNGSGCPSCKSVTLRSKYSHKAKFVDKAHALNR